MELLNACLSFGILCGALTPATTTTAAVVEVAGVEAPAPTPAPAASASAVLARVQAFYDGTTDLTANFKQTYTNQVFGSHNVTEGKLLLKKPGRMVWDYTKDADPDFYVDKKQLWVVEHDTRQVVSQKVDTNASLSGAMRFLFGGQKLIKDFKVRLASDKLAKMYGMPGHTLIELKPKKKNPHYKTLLLVVNDESGRVDAFVVRNQDNSINHFVLTNIQLNGGLKDAQFKYKVPKDYVETHQ
ncbi:MAG: outer membrane lipoprotein carrier protein LolA [Myxococcales bacterium]|nr:outer membrane lipoprotein carrier protein LolA [Myxococcales bacterium]